MFMILLLVAAAQAPNTTPVAAPTPRPQYQAAGSDLFLSPGRFNTYRNDRCGVTFSYPADWEAYTDLEGMPIGSCQVFLRPTTWDVTVEQSKFTEVDYEISLSVDSQPLGKALEGRGFQFLEGRWVYGVDSVDRQTPQIITGSGWQGYEITYLSRRQFKAKGPGTASQGTSTIVGNAHRSVSPSASIPDFDRYAYYAILRSLMFFSPSENR